MSIQNFRFSSMTSYFQRSHSFNLITLQDYAWEHIIREFLQNADDAGARIYRVIIDERTHTPETGDFKNMAVWQGPALLIFNDAKFKNEDFRGIQNFGEGGKQNDVNTIGRFGLGW